MLGHSSGLLELPYLLTQCAHPQTWCTNALLATLTACEDLRPAFNLSRGGCNIDAALVALQVGGCARCLAEWPCGQQQGYPV